MTVGTECGSNGSVDRVVGMKVSGSNPQACRSSGFFINFTFSGASPQTMGAEKFYAQRITEQLRMYGGSLWFFKVFFLQWIQGKGSVCFFITQGERASHGKASKCEELFLLIYRKFKTGSCYTARSPEPEVIVTWCYSRAHHDLCHDCHRSTFNF